VDTKVCSQNPIQLGTPFQSGQGVETKKKKSDEKVDKKEKEMIVACYVE